MFLSLVVCFLPAKLSGPIAFHALLDGHFTTTKEEQTLVFKNIETNLGGGYDSSTGVFTAPVTGLYFFAASAVALKCDYENKSLIGLNYKTRLLAVSVTDGTACTVQGTIKVSAGQKVWACSYSKGSVFVANITSFTGMLVLPDL